MEKIEKQIEEQMHKAFFDLIDEKTKTGMIDVDWLVNLFTELRDRLLKWIKKGSKTHIQIMESFDVELFKQMLENEVFDAESMVKLVNNSFDWIGRIVKGDGCEAEILTVKVKIFETESDKIISVFLKEIHKALDKMDEDIKNFILKIKPL